MAIAVIIIVGSPLIYLALLNAIGPSTAYHEPSVQASERLRDGTPVLYVGDDLRVNITVVRHRLNGSCRLDIRRFAHDLASGEHHMISKTEVQFVGQNELRRTQWPSPPDKYTIGYAIDESNAPKMDEPLLPPGVNERQFRLYVKTRYFCNVLDYIFPRYIQGGEREDETIPVNVVIRRSRA